jgi:hypothetical protein
MAEPMYKRVAEDLRARIEAGEIAPGSKLPTEVELMDEYGEKLGSPSGGVSISIPSSRRCREARKSAGKRFATCPR